MKKYSIGIDYGTESVRGILVDLLTGEEVAHAVSEYKHGVLDKALPNGTVLDEKWALQVPADYLNALFEVVTRLCEKSHIKSKQIVGLGIDFTSSTIIPTDKHLNPINELYPENPYAYVKLWKHHAAQKYADEITTLLSEKAPHVLKRYGGKVSSEWLFPKILQDIREQPSIFDKVDLYIEAGDWIVSKLVGQLTRSTNTLGFKALWHHEEGYLSESVLATVDENFKGIYESKLRGRVLPVGSKAGTLTEDMAGKLGLSSNVAVAVNIIDAHAANAAVGGIKDGDFVMALGTSTCQMLISSKEKTVNGITGYVKDGIAPGYFAYETGQAAVGDSFSWFVKNLVNEHISNEARQSDRTPFEVLEDKCKDISVGENRLIALDWLNGNRSDLNDSSLSGVWIGLTLATKPEDIYRALLESTAFGNKLILMNYLDAGFEVNRIFACGGLPKKSELFVQIYADVLNKPIIVAGSKENTALGAAIYGALAAGSENGGYDTLVQATEKMSRVEERVIHPNPENVDKYKEMYEIYRSLHDFFGIEKPAILKSLAHM